MQVVERVQRALVEQDSRCANGIGKPDWAGIGDFNGDGQHRYRLVRARGTNNGVTVTVHVTNATPTGGTLTQFANRLSAPQTGPASATSTATVGPISPGTSLERKVHRAASNCANGFS